MSIARWQSARAAFRADGACSPRRSGRPCCCASLGVVDREYDELALIDTLEMGKPITATKAGRSMVIRLIRYLRVWRPRFRDIPIPILSRWSCCPIACVSRWALSVRLSRGTVRCSARHGNARQHWRRGVPLS